MSGTIEAAGLGNFFNGDSPFLTWDITTVVGSPGGPTQSYSSTQANSTWALAQVNDEGLAAMTITDQFIFLNEVCLSGAGISADNSLYLANPSENKQLLYANPGCGSAVWITEALQSIRRRLSYSPKFGH